MEEFPCVRDLTEDWMAAEIANSAAFSLPLSPWDQWLQTLKSGLLNLDCRASKDMALVLLDDTAGLVIYALICLHFEVSKSSRHYHIFLPSRWCFLQLLPMLLGTDPTWLTQNSPLQEACSCIPLPVSDGLAAPMGDFPEPNDNL